MDPKTRTRRVNILMTRYIQLYEDKYGQKPTFNRNTEKWGFEYMLEDLGVDAGPTLEYYFSLRRSHTSQDLLRNYHEIAKWMEEDQKDAVRRRELLEQTKQRVEEFNTRWQTKP